MKWILLLIFALLVLVFVMSFAVLNADKVHVEYYFLNIETPLFVVILFSIVIGALLGVLSSMGYILRLQRDIQRLNKAVKLTEKEIENLRALPIKDQH